MGFGPPEQHVGGGATLTAVWTPAGLNTLNPPRIFQSDASALGQGLWCPMSSRPDHPNAQSGRRRSQHRGN